MPVLCLRTDPCLKKFGLTVYTISHGCLISAHIRVGGREGIEGEGKQLYLHTEQKAIHIKNATIYSLIVGLPDL
jgi:hypothetical protein